MFCTIAQSAVERLFWAWLDLISIEILTILVFVCPTGSATFIKFRYPTVDQQLSAPITIPHRIPLLEHITLNYKKNIWDPFQWRIYLAFRLHRLDCCSWWWLWNSVEIINYPTRTAITGNGISFSSLVALYRHCHTCIPSGGFTAQWWKSISRDFNWTENGCRHSTRRCNDNY